MKTKLLLYSALLLLTQCSKCKNDPAPTDPASQLPPATQTGANTFGCLLNGQPWTPSGNDGRANYRISYDPGYAGGSLTIRVYRYPGDMQKSQDFIIGGAPISTTGVFAITPNGPAGVSYLDSNLQKPCNEYYYGNTGFTSKGQIVITRLDLTQGIIAGTFSFTLHQPCCDSVKVTQGRFDKKL